MASRLELHEELCDLLGSRNCYYQPPESVKMSYPCIVYNQGKSTERYANDRLYSLNHSYDGIVISKDPEYDLVDKIAYHFPKCSTETPYVADNLYHWPFRVKY
jgi:hypothetical protein